MEEKISKILHLVHIYYDLYEDNLEFAEVIGNIYDNPELLEESND